VKDWFTWYAKRLDVPCIGVEGPCNVDHVTDGHVAAIQAQLRGLVPELEAISGSRLDRDRLKESVGLSRQCSALWEEALEKSAHKPSPASFVNYLTLLGPVIVARGTEAAVDYLRALVEELDARIENHIAAVSEERFRLYWDGMPVWGKLGSFTRLFIELKVLVAASTFCHSWVFDSLDPARPFESMARAYTELFIVRSDAAKERYLKKMARTFGIDGIVFHEARTCPSNSNNRYGMPARLRDALGVPCLTIYGDHNDLDLYNEHRTATQFEAFIEQLERS
jgi:benzoyl-CoA reductase/2-hydroxyglutaryl-CoA dehydratase subunit BcrC/BadD/HgdB